MNINLILTNKTVLTGIAGAVGACAAGVGGYFLGRHMERSKLCVDETRLREQNATIKELRRQNGALKLKLTEMKADKKAAEAPLVSEVPSTFASSDRTPSEPKKNYTAYSKKEQEAINEVVEAENQFDYDAEANKRSRGMPYNISEEQLVEKTDDIVYAPVTYTYFEGDDILLDEDGDVMKQYEEIVGYNNLRFGYGTTDDRICYVRNDDLELQIEIVLEDGCYYSQNELGHSDGPKVRKFRTFD